MPSIENSSFLLNIEGKSKMKGNLVLKVNNLVPGLGYKLTKRRKLSLGLKTHFHCISFNIQQKRANFDAQHANIYLNSIMCQCRFYTLFILTKRKVFALAECRFVLAAENFAFHALIKTLTSGALAELLGLPERYFKFSIFAIFQNFKVLILGKSKTML